MRNKIFSAAKIDKQENKNYFLRPSFKSKNPTIKKI